MTEDTYKYITSIPLDEQVRLLTVREHQHRHIPQDQLTRFWWYGKLRLVKRLQESSVLVKETLVNKRILLYHYEMPSRELTHLNLLDPDFVRDLDKRTEQLILDLAIHSIHRIDPQRSVI